MIFLLLPVPNGDIEVRARMEGDDIVGDMSQVVRPGGDFGGIPFADLQKLGPGEHDLDVDDPGDAED